jgi:chloride channel protein, CIC family
MPTISSQSTMDEVANLLKRYEVHAVPVVDGGKLVGVVAKLDEMRCIHEGRPAASVKEIMSSKLVITYPDESLFDAMNKMVLNHISQLPVVDRNNPDQLLGLLALDDVSRIQCTANTG